MMPIQDKHSFHVRSAWQINSLAYKLTKTQQLPSTSTHRLTNSRIHKHIRQAIIRKEITLSFPYRRQQGESKNYTMLIQGAVSLLNRYFLYTNNVLVLHLHKINSLGQHTCIERAWLMQGSNQCSVYCKYPCLFNMGKGHATAVHLQG